MLQDFVNLLLSIYAFYSLKRKEKIKLQRDKTAVTSPKYCIRNALTSRFHLPCMEIKGNIRFLGTICGYMDYIEESLFQHPSPSLSGNFSQEREYSEHLQHSAECCF